MTCAPHNKPHDPDATCGNAASLPVSNWIGDDMDDTGADVSCPCIWAVVPLRPTTNEEIAALPVLDMDDVEIGESQ